MVWLPGFCRSISVQVNGGCCESIGGPGWLGERWEVFGSQGKVREPRIEKVVPLEMGNFMEALWKGFGRKVVVGG